MQQEELDWKPTPKHISEYSIEKLPRGDEYSHSTFTPVRFKKEAKRGPQKKTDDEIHQEKVEAYRKKEAKLESLVEL